MLLLTAAAFSVLLIPGCFNPDSEPADSPKPMVLTKSYGPQDFPSDSQWIVIRVESQDTLPNLHMETRFLSHDGKSELLVPYRHPCLIMEGFSDKGVGGISGVNFGVYQGLRFRSSLGQQNVSFSNANDSSHFNWTFSLANGTTREGFFLVGLSTVHSLGPTELLQLDLASTTPFSSSIIGTGAMTCATQPDEFQQGTYQQMGITLGSGYFEATGLSSAFEIQSPAYLSVYANANQALQDAVLADGAIVWSEDSARAAINGSSEWWIDRPGQWEFTIEQARDFNGFPITAYLLIDGLPGELQPLLPKRGASPGL